MIKSNIKKMIVGLCASSVWVAIPTPSFAGTPRPHVVYSGQALDDFGWPYQTDAEVVLKVNGTERARQAIHGRIAPGMNFALKVLIDHGGDGEPYTDKAARVGEPVSISVMVDGVERDLVDPSAIPPIPEPGTQIFLNLNTGSDADSDGLSDIWEWDLIWNSEGALDSLEGVARGDDFDGDGATNGQEFDAGTIAYWAFDVFSLNMVRLDDPPGWFEIEFLSVPGKAYNARQAILSPGGSVWSSALISPNPGESLRSGSIAGDGGMEYLYVNPTESHAVFRLETR